MDLLWIITDWCRSLFRPTFGARSVYWSGVRKAHLESFPSCAACGTKRSPQVHHVVPVSVDPGLELDMDNLITLCNGPCRCHLVIGHLGSYKHHNPSVREDAAWLNEKIKSRTPSVPR